MAKTETTKRTVLRSQAREFVVRLQDYFEREYQNGDPLLPLSQVTKRVSATLGISRKTVSRISKEKHGTDLTEDNKLKSPLKKKVTRSIVTHIHNFDNDAIRNHIYGYYSRTELPTLDKLSNTLRESGLFHGSRIFLWRVLKKVGFSYKKCDNRRILMERRNIALARCNFLRSAKSIAVWNNVIFLDETWLNANHTVGKIWTDDTPQSSTKVPSGKSERLIICHAGSMKGFVQNCLLAFKSKKTVEYHEEMNFVKFKEWFCTLLTNLNKPSTVIMDNAPYHSVQISKPPTSSSKKADIVKWLNDNNIVANMSMLKVKLLHLVAINKPASRYVLDEIAKEAGPNVMRLPPYDCQYNAIELIWAKIKEACDSVPAANWESVVLRTKNLIFADWDRDIHIDAVIDNQIIINTGDSTDDDEGDDDDADHEISISASDDEQVLS
ncbi:hypothetical protein K1T71_002447 [Dendrolimus kikuchii]|uniref:Uncharacterized protein n=1 Tax=Dendrolimus kikuchii TaxID=765133 RepID=A0ACC1DD00_9NEOP|nr:hypothetical protein K1T71_002447 [Dendrolimus kikuchii]